MSLRTFLLLVTGIAFVLAWYVPSGQKQKRTADWIVRSGGRYRYYNQLYDDRFRLENCLPESWVATIGMDYFSAIRLVEISGHSLEDLSMIGELTHLEYCNVRDTGVTDLSALSNHRNLQTLSVAKNPIDDLSPLTRVQSLQHLDISRTEVVDLSVIRDLKNLNALSIYASKNIDLSPLAEHPSLIVVNLGGSQIDDISPLKTIESLRYVYLTGSKVPQSQVDELQSAIPECRIIN